MSALDEVDQIANQMFGQNYHDLPADKQELVLDAGQNLAEQTGGSSARSQSPAGRVVGEGLKYGIKEAGKYGYDLLTGGGADAATAGAAQAGEAIGSQLAGDAVTGGIAQAGEQIGANLAAQQGSFLSNLVPSLSSLGPMAAAAIIARAVTLMTKDRNKTKFAEEQKAARLANEGVKLPDSILKLDTHEREDLAPDFVGMDANGNYVNNKFNNSRDEKDLDTEMIMRTGAPYDLFEGDPEAIRRVVDKGRELGAFREQYGQIQSYLTPELEAAAAANGVKLRKGRDQYSLAIGDVNDNNNIYGGIGVADMPTTERQMSENNFYSDKYNGRASPFDQMRTRARDGETPEALALRMQDQDRKAKEDAERLKKIYEDRYNAYLAANGGSKLPVATPPTLTPKPADVTAVPDPQPSKEVAPDTPPAKEAQSLYAPMSADDNSMLDLLNLPGRTFEDQIKQGGKAAQIEAQLGRRASNARRGRIGSRREML